METEKNEPIESTQVYVSEDARSPLPEKKKPKRIFVVLIVIVVLLMVGWFLIRQGTSSRFTQIIPQPVIPQAQVTINSTGFLPQTLLIKKGTQVTWINTDKKSHQVVSDPHPVHSQLPALNETKPITSNSSYSYIFSTSGTFTYHDEQNPLKFKGTVVVN